MKIEAQFDAGQTTLVGKPAGVADGALLVSLLALRQYTDPQYAAVRELFTNACDSHIEADNATQPFEVDIQVNSETRGIVFTLRDYGIGMSKAFLSGEEDDPATPGQRRGFFKLGTSTKSDNMQAAGGFGIGAKAVFALSEMMLVTVYDGNESTQAAGFLDPDQGICVQMYKSEPCKEPRGVKIEFGFESENRLIEEKGQWLKVDLYRYQGPAFMAAVARALAPVGHHGGGYFARPIVRINGIEQQYVSVQDYQSDDQWIFEGKCSTAIASYRDELWYSDSFRDLMEILPDNPILWHNAAFMLPKDLVVDWKMPMRITDEQRREKIINEYPTISKWGLTKHLGLTNVVYLSDSSEHWNITPDRMQIVSRENDAEIIKAKFFSTLMGGYDYYQHLWQRAIDAYVELRKTDPKQAVYEFNVLAKTYGSGWAAKEFIQHLKTKWPNKVDTAGMRYTAWRLKTLERLISEVSAHVEGLCDADLYVSEYQGDRWRQVATYGYYKDNNQLPVCLVTQAKHLTRCRTRIALWCRDQPADSAVTVLKLPNNLDATKVANELKQLLGDFPMILVTAEELFPEGIKAGVRAATPKTPTLYKLNGVAGDYSPVTVEEFEEQVAEGGEHIWLPIKGHGLNLHPHSNSIDEFHAVAEWLGTRTDCVLWAARGKKHEKLFEQHNCCRFDLWVKQHITDNFNEVRKLKKMPHWYELAIVARELLIDLDNWLVKNRGISTATWWSQVRPSQPAWAELRVHRLLGITRPAGSSQRLVNRQVRTVEYGVYSQTEKCRWIAELFTAGAYRTMYLRLSRAVQNQGGAGWSTYSRVKGDVERAKQALTALNAAKQYEYGDRTIRHLLERIATCLQD